MRVNLDRQWDRPTSHYFLWDVRNAKGALKLRNRKLSAINIKNMLNSWHRRGLISPRIIV